MNREKFIRDNFSKHSTVHVPRDFFTYEVKNGWSQVNYSCSLKKTIIFYHGSLSNKNSFQVMGPGFLKRRIMRDITEFQTGTQKAISVLFFPITSSRVIFKIFPCNQ